MVVAAPWEGRGEGTLGQVAKALPWAGRGGALGQVTVAVDGRRRPPPRQGGGRVVLTAAKSRGGCSVAAGPGAGAKRRPDRGLGWRQGEIQEREMCGAGSRQEGGSSSTEEGRRWPPQSRAEQEVQPP